MERRLFYMACMAYGLALAWMVTPYLEDGPANPSHAAAPEAEPDGPSEAPVRGGAEWFRAVKPSCNPVEVELLMERRPPPDGFQGTAYGAGCLALAGQIQGSREMLLSLPPEERWRAAGVVFDLAHAVADAGNEVAAGPVMELVVEFWPNHYMALYHAGASSFRRGEPDRAGDYLERFLEHYGRDDGWRRSALAMLAELGAR